MTVGFDASSESAITSTNPQTGYSHTPSGTPRGVVVFVYTESTTDAVTSLTYGGVTMTRVRSDHGTGGDESRSTYVYFLGASVPTGTQALVLTKTSAINGYMVAVSLTGSDDLAVQDHDGTGVAQANPGLTLDPAGKTCLTLGMIYSGLDTAPGGLTMGSGMTAMQEASLGFAGIRVDRQTTPDSSNFTFGYTSASDDVSLSVVTITEGEASPPPPASGSPLAPPKVTLGVTIDGRPVQLLDWTAEVAVNHGDRSLTGTLPREVIWPEQGSEVTIWRGPDDALWSGELTADPRVDGELLRIRAHGGAEKVAELSSQAGTLPFYRADGAERWEPSEGDPFNHQHGDQIDSDARGGRLVFSITPDELYAVSARSGLALWVEGGLITRVRYIFRKGAASTDNYDIRTIRFTGPDGSQTTVNDLPCGGSTADNTTNAFNITTPEDAVEIQLRCNTGFTPSQRQKYWLTNLRVYGRTNDDAFSASQVVADVAQMAGLATDNIQDNALGVLPLWWEEDHPALLSYMAEVCDWRWMVRHAGMEFGPYERTWQTATDHGAIVDLEPQPRYNVFVQPYRTMGGRLRRATATADPDPFPAEIFAAYGEPLTDPQPDGTLAALVASARVAHLSQLHMAGPMELIEVRENGSPSDPVLVDAGDLLSVTDLAPTLGPQRISVATYHQRYPEGRVKVSVQIGDEFNLVRTMREADRQAKAQRARR